MLVVKILLILIIVLVILLFILGVMSRSGEAIGLVDGHLSSCPGKPNCVSSEQASDSGHYIAPISLPEKGADDVLLALKNIIGEMGGSIAIEGDGYLAATFASTIFRFVDDLEIRVDSTQNVIHIRSASRVGHGDVGVNRKRTEVLKQLFEEKMLQHQQGAISP